MNESIEELLSQPTNMKHSLYELHDNEHNYVYVMDVLQQQHSEHVIQLQRQHKDHVEHMERQVAQLERQVQLLQHHLLRRP